jgi:repressor LexA
MTRKKPTPLKPKARRLLSFIQNFMDEHGYQPSYRDMMAHLGYATTSAVDYQLKKLIELGYIERSPNVARSLRVVQEMVDRSQKVGTSLHRTAQDILKIPIVGRIVASAPIPVPASSFTHFDAETAIDIAMSMLPKKNVDLQQLFALEVDGDSMVDDMVNDGDIVIMQAGQETRNGDMVAVLLPEKDETTLKRFYYEPNHNRYRLQPANPTMEPIYISDQEEIQIQGKVLMIISPM